MKRKPTWELKAIIKVLSLHPWLNTEEEQQRLDDAREELASRSKAKVKVKQINEGVTAITFGFERD